MADPINRELLEAFFDDARDVMDEWEKASLSLSSSLDLRPLTPILRCAHNLKGSAGMAGLSELHSAIHQIEDYLVKLRDLAQSPSPEILDALLATDHFLRSWVGELKKNPRHTQDISQLAGRLEHLLNTSANANSPQSSEVPSRPKSPKIEEKSSRKNRGEDTLRVSVNKLDHLIRLVGEISLQQTILDRASRSENLDFVGMLSAIDLQSKLTQDLQDAALSLRMIPIQGLFQKAERVIRETAHAVGRKVEVHRKGDEVALDKLVVDGMLEPLIHIARNAVDHGIELPEDRILAGKSPSGQIHITAENTAGGVTLLFEDDGRGIDPDRVLQKAVAKGLVPEEESYTTDDRLQMIFLPGLSTADQVTEISGRGVGMDVVADTVKKMGGRIEIKSQLGKGTQLMLTLPTNLSILDALVVRVNSQQYALPNQDLSEVLNLNDFEVQDINGSEAQVINLRGKIVPIEHMGTFLAGAPENRPVNRAAVVVQFRDEPLALVVDKVLGQQKVFVRPIAGHMANVSFYEGSTILSDGEPTMILNLPEMARRYFTSH